jgi:hypothetical protein
MLRMNGPLPRDHNVQTSMRSRFLCTIAVETAIADVTTLYLNEW